MQHLKPKEIDETTQAALDLLPDPQRRVIDSCVVDLTSRIGDRSGGRGFGVKRGRELVFALGMWMIRQESE